MSFHRHVAGAAVALAVGCSETAGPVPVIASVSVTPDTVSIEMRDTAQLTAVLKDSSGRVVAGVRAQWSSSDITRAIVLATGKVIGVRAGLVWIRAGANGYADSARVSVLVPVASLAVVPATVTLVKGAIVQVSPFPRDSAGNYLFRTVTWSSSDSAKARIVSPVPCSVGSCAVVSANDSGSVTITAAAGHQQATAQLSQAIVRFQLLSSAQDHTCGLTQAGEVWCWGLNTVGQLAVPYYDHPRTTPGLVRGGLRFTQITAGGGGSGGFTCGVTPGFAAYCWGENNTNGQLGSHAPTPDTVPSPVAGSLQFTAVSAGGVHACALAIGGRGYCWGDNGAHQLGTDTLQTPEAYQPIPVEGGLTFVSLHAGDGHTCALTTSGAAYCWGANDLGQLGTDSPPPTSNYGPRLVQGGLTLASITAGSAHTCALTPTGFAYCWGRNDFGQLGNGDTLDTRAPVAVTGGLTFGAIAAGTVNTCGITTGGTAYCWGANTVGQLGIGGPSPGPHGTPMAVSGAFQFASIETRSGETCAITSSGLAYCWGWNLYGQLGNGTYDMASAPVLVVGQR